MCWCDGQLLSPEEAVTGVGGRGQAAEPKPLFALNVRQHEGEVLPHLVDRQTGQKTGETRQSDWTEDRGDTSVRQRKGERQTDTQTDRPVHVEGKTEPGDSQQGLLWDTYECRC